MDSIRETLAKRNLNPTDKLIDILQEIENDESKFNQILKENPQLESARIETMYKSRTLKHKVLKDLVTAKQTEDDQLLKLKQLEKDSKAQQGAKIPLLYQHQRKQLPDGRWVIEIAKEETT